MNMDETDWVPVYRSFNVHPVTTPALPGNPQARVILPDPESTEKIPVYNDPLALGLMVSGFFLVLASAIGMAIYRHRKRSYEQFLEDGTSKRGSIASKSLEPSLYGCVTQNRSIDFVVPNITTAVTSLPSPVDTVSLSSGSSPDVSLWARLALLEGGGLPGTSLLGGLNPELYKVGLEEPEEEIYFPDGNKGRIWFGVEYDASSERLVVHLIKIKNLPSRVCGSINCCDPFVRISLMPDERRYLQSKQKKKTCNPRFEETFVFQIPVRTLNERAIKLTVYDNDRGKRYNIIGHVIYPLRELNEATTTETLLHWRDLEKEEMETLSNFGELLVSLCYNQNLERLTVTVFEARGLRLPNGFTTLDSYVKVTFLKDNKVAKTKKTVIAKKTTEPKYNESFNFRLTQNLLNSVSVILQVTVAGAQKDKILGRVVLGSYMFARGKPLDHWNESMSAGYRQVRHWHKLT